MKNSLILMCMGIVLFNFTNAQVIELIGMGAKNVNPATLIISDPLTVDHVVVEAAAVFRTFQGDPEPGQVTFSDANETYPVSFNLVEQDLSPQWLKDDFPQKWGYYTATFNDVDNGGISLDNMGQGDYILSFTAYIYRNDGDPEIYNFVEYDHAFVFRMGVDNPLVYNFTIPWSNESRDIEVVVPISELTEDGRFVFITLTAGPESVHLEFDSNNLGDLLNLQSIILQDVPGDITEVELEIASPTQSSGGKDGDSFITGAISLATTFQQGCTATQGYWKTHSIYGPASKPDDTWYDVGPLGPDELFYIADQTWIEVFNTSVNGNAYYQLAHQFMAAYLNMLKGTLVPSEVQTALDNAHLIFSNNGPDYYEKIKGKSLASKDEISQLVSIAEVLTSYNEGLIGPGHCDENEPEEGLEKSARIALNDFNVFPNPVKSSLTVSFKPLFDGKVTVDLYNSMGQVTSRLMDQDVKKNIPVNYNYNVEQFQEGLYILLIRNESSWETTKIEIKK